MKKNLRLIVSIVFMIVVPFHFQTQASDQKPYYELRAFSGRTPHFVEVHSQNYKREVSRTSIPDDAEIYSTATYSGIACVGETFYILESVASNRALEINPDMQSFLTFVSIKNLPARAKILSLSGFDQAIQGEMNGNSDQAGRLRSLHDRVHASFSSVVPMPASIQRSIDRERRKKNEACAGKVIVAMMLSAVTTVTFLYNESPFVMNLQPADQVDKLSAPIDKKSRKSN